MGVGYYNLLLVSPSPRRLVAGLSLAALAAASAIGAWALLRPLDVHDALVRWKLWRGGVRRARLDGLSVLVRDTCGGGECRCAVLIHGLGDSAETWERVLAGDRGAGPVPPGWRLYAVDMPGTGTSRPPASPEGYGIREQARALKSALEPACGRWTVVGNSLGGWIAVWLALEWPEGIERLILLSSAGLEDPSGRAVEAAKALAWPTVEKMRDFVARCRYKPPVMSDRALAQIARMIERRPTRRTALAISKNDFLDGRLGALSLPVLILWGEADRVIPPSQGDRFRAALTGAKLRVLPRCGHIPQSECPENVTSALYSR